MLRPILTLGKEALELRYHTVTLSLTKNNKNYIISITYKFSKILILIAKKTTFKVRD